jgi:hypothetical protein
MGYGDAMHSASSSTIIHFRPWDPDSGDYILESNLQHNLQSLVYDSDAFSSIDHLKLVALLGSEYRPVPDNPPSMTDTMELVLPEMDALLIMRAYAGNDKPLRVTIQFGDSPEGEAGAVSRVIRQPGDNN